MKLHVVLLQRPGKRATFTNIEVSQLQNNRVVLLPVKLFIIELLLIFTCPWSARWSLVGTSGNIAGGG